MNTELLREDELYKPWPSESGLKDWIGLVELLRQRLIEEREKNDALKKRLRAMIFYMPSVILTDEDLVEAVGILEDKSPAPASNKTSDDGSGTGI